MNKLQVEIRSAEGGEESKLLVASMQSMYVKFCKFNCL
jgi:protein subunit release factor A